MKAIISTDAILHHVRYFARNCKNRYSGTERQLAAARYIFEQLNGAGIAVELKEFSGYGCRPVHKSLEIASPAYEKIECEAVCYSIDLPEADYLLADAGDGIEASYLKTDVRGKIVLLDAFRGPMTPEKARIAQEKGAVGMVLITAPAPQGKIRTFRAFKGVWGNPDRVSIGRIPQICAVSISYEDGIRLRRKVTEEKVSARLHAVCETGWVKLYEPVAMVRAQKRTDEFIMVTGHVDAWAEGATDNGSGVGLMIELAKYFEKHRALLKRNLVFAFYDGHEILEATGSSCLAENCWDLIRDHGVMELNIDSPGLRGANGYITYSCFELMPAIRRVHSRAGIAERSKILPVTRDSDRSYLAMGLPGFLTVESGPAGESGVPFGWWCHTAEDTIDKLEKTSLAATSELFRQYILEFAGGNKAPLSASEPVREFTWALEQAVDACGNTLDGVDFSSIISQMKRLTGLCAELDLKGAEDPEECLAVYRRLFQLMAPVFYTASDRYGQDNYGDIRYENPVPRLEPLRKIAAARIGGGDYYLLRTECVRVRNLLSDFCRNACDLCTRNQRNERL